MTTSLADAVLVLRTASGMTQVELAQKVGIAQGALSRYENGLREPDDDTLERLVGALGVTSASHGPCPSARCAT